MKVFVAIPSRDGRLCAETAVAILNEERAAAMLGAALHLEIVPGCSAPHFARDQLAGLFLASDCDRLVFVDDDVSWRPGSLVKLAMAPVDLCGGAYRFKQDKEGYPVQWLPKAELWADPLTGLLEVFSLPGGFLSISRIVFETMRVAHPERAYQHQGHRLHGFFQMPYGGGEDTQFCADWRALGGQVWLDPEIALDHHGGLKTYLGHIGNWLRARPQVEAV